MGYLLPGEHSQLVIKAARLWGCVCVLRGELIWEGGLEAVLIQIGDLLCLPSLLTSEIKAPLPLLL